MSLLTMVTMVVVITLVWGGFLICLALALRREKTKK